jgi:hypothetical protein
MGGNHCVDSWNKKDSAVPDDEGEAARCGSDVGAAVSVATVARAHGVNANEVFYCRKFYTPGRVAAQPCDGRRQAAWRRHTRSRARSSDRQDQDWKALDLCSRRAALGFDLCSRSLVRLLAGPQGRTSARPPRALQRNPPGRRVTSNLISFMKAVRSVVRSGKRSAWFISGLSATT